MTRHGIGTTPNITKPCERCNGTGEREGWSGNTSFECIACNGTGEIVVMKGGTPRIEDWPGAEVGGEGELTGPAEIATPGTPGQPTTADLSPEQGQERYPTAWAYEQACKALSKAHADNRALMEALREADRHFRDGKVNRGQLVIQAALETVSGQGEKP